MSPVPSALRGRLARLRLVSRRSAAVVGTGDRTGRAVGAGIEFAEYRAYQPGDDARAIDPSVYARLGQTVVRTRLADQGLSVTILVDQTASMATGNGGRASLARDLAASIVYASLSAGDRARLAVLDGAGVSWAPGATDVRRADGTFRWLDERRPFGRFGLVDAVAQLEPNLHAHGVCVVVTDGWFEDAEVAIRRLTAADQEVVLLVLAEAAELDPARMVRGAFRLVDAETGKTLDVQLDAAALERRGRAVAAWHEGLAREVRRGGGRSLVVAAHRPLHRILLQDLVVAGVLA